MQTGYDSWRPSGTRALPRILTPNDVPEFVIPRSPSNHSADYRYSTGEDLHTRDWRRDRQHHKYRLFVPDDDEGMRRRSSSTPPSPEHGRKFSHHSYKQQQPKRYTPDELKERAFRKHSYDPERELINDTHWQNCELERNEGCQSFSSRSLNTLMDRKSPDGSRRRLPPTPEEGPSTRLLSPGHRQLPQPGGQTALETRIMGGRGSLGAHYSSRSPRKLPAVPDLTDKYRSEARSRQFFAQSERRYVSQTPPPSASTNGESSSQHPSVRVTINGYQPDVHGEHAPQSRRYCARRPSEQSFASYMDTTCTCRGEHPHKASDHGRESRSSSDTEDPAALGIQPELYREPSPTSSAQDFSSPRQTDSALSAGTGSIEIPSLPPSPSPTEEKPDNVAKSPKTPSASTSPVPVETKPKPKGVVLTMSVQYFSARKRLRVSVMKVEGLAMIIKDDFELHAFVKICLNPGKLQKQQSRIVKPVKDALFNEEFFFDNVPPEDVMCKTVSIRLCHHVGKQFQKDIVIGELEVKLGELHTLMSKKEIRLTEAIKTKISSKKLGRLQVACSLEKDTKRMTVNVIKAEDLPKSMTGPPDPCVRITVEQLGKVQVKQTRTIKHTCTAVYKEAVMFLISVNKGDMEQIKVTLDVFNTGRNESIGQAFLGTSAMDKSETDQWKSMLSSIGREVKATHYLKYPQED